MVKGISNRTAIIIYAVLTLLVTGLVGYKEYKAFNILYFIVRMGSSTNGVCQVYFDTGNGYNGKDSYKFHLQNKNLQKYIFLIPANDGIKSIRFDPLDTAGEVQIKAARIVNKQGDIIKKFSLRDFKAVNQISAMNINKGILNIKTLENAKDPILEIANSSLDKYTIGTDYLKKHGWIITGYGLLSFLILSGLNYLVMFFWRKRSFFSGLRHLKKYLTVYAKILYEFIFRNLGLATNVGLWIVVLITIIAVFVPFSPSMPAAGLDPSWMFGMNQGIAQGLSIGKEIIFTFGPFASVFTQLYHPSTDFMMVGGSLYLALSYLACFIILMRGVRLPWVLAFCASLAGLMYLRDALFFSFPLLVGLTTFKIVFSADGAIARSRYAPFLVALMFAPFGLIPLIKGTMLILCVAIAVLCSVFFVVNRKSVLAIICLVSPLVSILLFWIASGQSVTSLPNYFTSMGSIVSGFTEAMSSSGSTLEIIFYLVASVFILVSISLQKQINRSSKIFLLCILFVFLFLAFKAGFVRHDLHAVTPAISILMAALLLPFIFNSRMLLLAIVFSLISCLYIYSHYVNISPSNIFNNIVSTYSTQWHGFKNRIEIGNWPRRDFDTVMTSLRKQASFPVLQGTTDIYSFNQAYLISSGNTWSPRPIFQSYSVYTPALAEINRNHLLGEQAPDNIIFSVEPISGRVPSIEDGASWPVLMANYQPTHVKNDFLFLRKKAGTSEYTEPLKLTSETHAFGENVNIPQSSQSIFAQLEIKPTFWGRIASLLFKPSQLQITFELKNGRKKQYRMIAGMAKSGFLLSPLIENTEEFGMLYVKNCFLDAKRVKSFSILPDQGKSMLWHDEYTVTLSQISVTSAVDFSKIIKFDNFDTELSGSKVTFEGKCNGNIDMVDNMSPASERILVSGMLRVNGWLATSLDKAMLQDTVYVVLTDDHGNRSYLRTQRTPRPDVGEYLKNPELKDCGFSTLGDISLLEGQYILSIAVKHSDKIKIYPQFKIPITITKSQEN